MAKCRYCGQGAGIFRNFHKPCKARYEAGWETMVSSASKAARTGDGLDTLDGDLAREAESSLVRKESIPESLVQGWERALHDCLEDNVLSADEESKLMAFAQRFSLTQEQLNERGAYRRAAMNIVLREILEGKTPRSPTISGTVPFNFQKSESLVWVFTGVRYLESRTSRQYVGGYSGVSVRVMKGVYYRTGGFRGRPVDTTQTVQVDAGILGITTQNLYFEGTSKRFRIPYTKIVSFEPYTDGIGVQRDAMTAKPQTFVTGEGWFVYNAVVNLAKR
ncbi:MAG: hypothetical protein LAO51_16020 [Acidobacteriia bacterium]|nr:hypothetical protein [Terriglobia bacterium]